MDEIVAAYLAGEYLPDGDRKEAERWLWEHAEKKGMKFIRGLFRGARLVKKSSAEEREFIFRRLEKEVRHRQRRRRIGWYSSGAAVAVVLLGIVLMYWKPVIDSEEASFPAIRKMDVSKAHLRLSTGEVIELDKYQGRMIREDGVRVDNADFTLRYSSDSAALDEVKYDTLVIPRGSEYSIVLADGTKVFLNAGSEIYYPVVFSGNKREVGLKGEAYFEVAKDERRPFFVQAGNIRVRVLGTSFNVTSYPGRKRIETTLEEGWIQITDGKEQVDVVPGEQVVYDKNNGSFNVKSVDTKLYTSWKDGYYKFDQMTLENIMETLSLWYDLNVFYANDDVKLLEFTGRLRRYDRVEGLFRKFEQTDLVKFELNGKNVVIRKK